MINRKAEIKPDNLKYTTSSKGGNIFDTIKNAMSKLTIGAFIPSTGKYNIGAAITWLNNAVGTSKASGKCAKYVRSAIDVGFGTNPNNDTSFTGKHGRPISAYKYSNFLPKLGFKHVTSLSTRAEQTNFTNSAAAPGDIAVMAHGVHGHICMFTGNAWVSDFVQKNIWVYSGDGLVEIFRYAGN